MVLFHTFARVHTAPCHDVSNRQSVHFFLHPATISSCRHPPSSLHFFVWSSALPFYDRGKYQPWRCITDLPSPSCTHCLCFFHISRDAMQASLAGDISYHTTIAFGGRVGTLDAVGYVQLLSVSAFCLYVQFVSDSFLCCGALQLSSPPWHSNCLAVSDHGPVWLICDDSTCAHFILLSPQRDLLSA